MAYPQQTFNNLQDLLDYINTFYVTNGNEDIDAVIGNNIVNALGNFFPKYAVNGNTADIKSTGGAVVLDRPMTVIMTTVPTTLTWLDNVQNEYYIINATGFNIPLLSGTRYYDQYLTAQTFIPARTTIHISKVKNGNWIFAGNLGGGGGGSLPPQAGNEGKGLTTNGSSANWQFMMPIELDNSDFEPDGITCLSPKISGLTNFIIWCLNINNWVNKKGSPPEFYFVPGGFKMNAPWFDINTDNWNFNLFPQAPTS